MRTLTILLITLALSACGGGAADTANAVHTFNSPLRSAALATNPSPSTTAIQVYQALYGKAPGYAQLQTYVTVIGRDNGFAWANSVASSASALTDAALATLVLQNIRITPTTLKATPVFGTAQQAYTGLQQALTDYFTSVGKANRGTVILQLAQIIASFEGETQFGVYGNAATAFNLQVSANLTYSASASNTAEAVVPVPCSGSTVGCTTLVLSKVTPNPTVAAYATMMYAQKMTIKVVDSAGIAVPDQTVQWTANSGGWAVPAVGKTNGLGEASVRWVAGDSPAPTLTATTIDRQGASASISFTGATKPDVRIDGNKTPNSAISHTWDNSDVTGFSSDMTPLTEPTGTYYAMNWDGGYTGIQRGGSDFDRQLQFSVWNANNVPSSIVNPGKSKCLDFSHEGSGVMCSASYPWAINKTYRFEMTTATVLTGFTDITVNFIDVATGTRLFLATLRQAGVPGMNGTSFFSEDFKRDYLGCKNVPEKSVVISNVQVQTKDAGWTTPASSQYQAYSSNPVTTCANSGYLKTANGSLQLGIGGTTTYRTTNTTNGQWEAIVF